MSELRTQLVEVALAWQGRYGVAPQITSAVSEYDAALLVGMTDEEFSEECVGRTAVMKGFDFRHRGLRYQVKANRPSGRPGSPVTLVAKVNNHEWDRLVWVLYDTHYRVVEAWEWEREDYRARLGDLKRLGPKEMRGGRRLCPAGPND